ncbi:MAG: putative sugar O-methyltransferase [Bacteriovorax sp.]|jgi:hypothetical protein
MMDEIDYLLKTYYTNTNPSASVTSSHWAIRGEEQTPIYREGKLYIQGRGGFGDFVPKNFFSSLKYNLFYRPVMKLYINKYSQNKRFINASKLIARKNKWLHTADCVKSALVLETILSTLKIKNFKEKNINSVCIIGDGYGYLGTLLKLIEPDVKIFSINLGRQQLFDYYTTRNVHPEKKLLLYKDTTRSSEVEKADFIFIEAQNYQCLENLNIDLFINIVSMQEMNNSVIQNYFKYMRNSLAKNKYFFCLNRVEKILPDGEVVSFKNYPWEDCEILLDEQPQWYQHYLRSRPPFWMPLDGNNQMRLVRF